MSPLLWSSLMEQLMKILKDERPSGAILIILLLAAIAAYAWATDEFVARGEFEVLQETVDDGFERIEINNASQVIRDTKLKILVTGATTDSESEMSRLSEELLAAEAYKTCLVERKPNCEHLKEVE